LPLQVEILRRAYADFFARLGYAYEAAGAIAFGLLVGWLCHLVVTRSDRVSVRWFSSLVAIIGGGTTLMASLRESYLFASYSFGLLFGYGAHSALSSVLRVIAPYAALLVLARDAHAKALRQELESGSTDTPLLDSTLREFSGSLIWLAVAVGVSAVIAVVALVILARRSS
jgi:hypothetical protein